jgi:hypothetical protein
MPKRLRVCGLPRGPNMRMRLLGGVPVASPSFSKPTVALMYSHRVCRIVVDRQRSALGDLQAVEEVFEEAACAHKCDWGCQVAKTLLQNRQGRDHPQLAGSVRTHRDGALQGDWGNFDVIAGFRISGSTNVWNGIGGFRAGIRIRNSGFFIPYYFDIGAGGPNLTWQIASGVGYQTG